jgi:hypothetical protein
VPGFEDDEWRVLSEGTPPAGSQRPERTGADAGGVTLLRCVGSVVWVHDEQATDHDVVPTAAQASCRWNTADNRWEPLAAGGRLLVARGLGDIRATLELPGHV